MADAAQHLRPSPTICGIAFGDTKAPTSTVCSPAADQRLDEGDTVGDADRGLLVLQAVARADLDDANGVAHAVPHEAAGSTSASSTPSPTMSPTLHLIFFNTPA